MTTLAYRIYKRNQTVKFLVLKIKILNMLQISIKTQIDKNSIKNHIKHKSKIYYIKQLLSDIKVL